MTNPTECPACGEISLKPIREDKDLIEWECEECKHYQTTTNPNYVPFILRNQAE